MLTCIRIKYSLDIAASFDINKFMNYEYECEKCEVRFERNVSSADRDLPTKENCPCGKGGKIFRVFELSGSKHCTNLINTKEKKAGGQWTSTLERINKTAGSASTLGKYI